MRIAVLSDIHGNQAALKAVLADIKARDVDVICCAGDLVGYGPFPNEVIEIIRAHQIAGVMGNYDDAIGFSRIVCGCDYADDESAAIGSASINWTSQIVTEKNKEFLRQLPFEIDMSIDTFTLKIVHGSPRRLNEYLIKDMKDKVLNELLIECNADVLVCGHTHVPYVRTIGEKMLVNSGSVGKPKHGDPRASYCIIEINDEINAEICFTEYDFESTVKAIIDAGLPPKLAELIKTGKS